MGIVIPLLDCALKQVNKKAVVCIKKHKLSSVKVSKIWEYVCN